MSFVESYFVVDSQNNKLIVRNDLAHQMKVLYPQSKGPILIKIERALHFANPPNLSILNTNHKDLIIIK